MLISTEMIGNVKTFRVRVEITVNYEAGIRLVGTCVACVDFHGGRCSRYVGLGRECIDYRFICRSYVYPMEF
jgi:hypothetical protein